MEPSAFASVGVPATVWFVAFRLSISAKPPSVNFSSAMFVKVSFAPVSFAAVIAPSAYVTLSFDEMPDTLKNSVPFSSSRCAINVAPDNA